MRRHPIIGLLHFAQRHARFVIIVSILLTLFFAFFMTKVTMTSDIKKLLPEDEEINLLMKEYGGTESDDEFLIVAVSDENPYTLDGLALLHSTYKIIETLPNIGNGLNPFTIMTFENDGSRLRIVPTAPNSRAPLTIEELETFKERLLYSDIARNLLVSRDGRILIAVWPVKVMHDYGPLMDDIYELLEPLEEYFNVYVSGSVPFVERTGHYLSRDFTILMSLALLIILLMYFLGFRSKRAVILPVMIVLMGTIWCLGFMGIMGFSLTIVSIITPPLVLTLGSSYSIHILNQIYRETENDKNDSEKVTEAVGHINKTIVLASLTTIVGFLSLIATSMQQTREFAISTSVGIASAALLSLFFFPAVLSRLPGPTAKQKRRVTHGITSNLMKNLSVFVTHHQLKIIFVVLLMIIGFIISVNNLILNTDTMSYFPAKDSLLKDMNFLLTRVGGFNEINLSLTAPGGEKGYFLNPSVLNEVYHLEEELKRNKDFSYSSSLPDYLIFLNKVMNGNDSIPENRPLILLFSRYFKALISNADAGSLVSKLANDDFSRITLSFRVYNSEENRELDESHTRKIRNWIQAVTEENLPEGTSYAIWGTSLRYLVLSDMIRQDLWLSLGLSLTAIFLITTISFRSLKFGFFAMIPIIIGVMMNFILMAALRIPLDMTTIMLFSIAIGVGVDDAIHFLLQFRKQKELHPRNIKMVIFQSLRITGRPILLTTVSIVAGMSVLIFASFKPIIYFGVLVIFALSSTCIGTLVALPAVLALFFQWQQKKKSGTILSPWKQIL